MVRQNRSALVLAWLVLACAMVFAAPVRGAFHLWTINEVFSNADGTIQFIEMRCAASNGENRIANHLLESDSQSFNVPVNLPSTQTANRFFLFATDGFASLPGAVTPDYVIPDAFFSASGDSLLWAGLNNTRVTFAAGQLPLDGRMSLLRDLSLAVNSPTNFAGASGSIDLTPPPVLGDTNGDLAVNLDDLNNVRNFFGTPTADGDADHDGDTDLDDLNAVRNNFGAGPASVPEPAAGAIAALSALGVAILRRAQRP